jgi:hypothetical protein
MKSKEMQCRICGQNFDSKQELRGHKKCHEDKFVGITCDHCGDENIQEESLKQHMENHEDERIELIECDELLQKYK